MYYNVNIYLLYIENYLHKKVLQKSESLNCLTPVVNWNKHHIRCDSFST